MTTTDKQLQSALISRGWWANLARRREHYAQLHAQAKRWGVEVIALREENEQLRMQASRRETEIRGLREMLAHQESKP